MSASLPRAPAPAPESLAAGVDGRVGLAILGATGTIGVNTLDLVRRHPSRFRAVALSAGRQVDRLFEQCLEFRPELVSVTDPDQARVLQARVRAAGLPTEVATGAAGSSFTGLLEQAASSAISA